jgi:hypothetical protein
MQSIADQIRTALAKSPGSAEAVAKQFDAQLIIQTKAVAGEAIPTLGVTPEIDGTLLTMKKGEVSPVLALPGNRLAVVVLNDRVAAHPAEFADVEDMVKQRLIAEKAQALADEQARQVAEKIHAGEDLEKTAKAMKLDVVTSGEFGHSDSVDGIGPATYVETAFTTPVGGVFGPINIQGRSVIGKVLDKQSPAASQLAQQRTAALGDLKQKKAVETNSLFLDSVLNQMIADGTVKVRRDAIQRVLASVRR